MTNAQQTIDARLSAACDAAHEALVKSFSASNMDALERAHKKYSDFLREVYPG